MKLKMAFVDLSNFKDWPMGGMLEYELTILKNLVKHYDIEIWGVSVDGVTPQPLEIDGTRYKIHIFGNVLTKKRVIPNFWKGMNLILHKGEFLKRQYDIVYAHTGSCLVAASLITKNKHITLAYHQHGLSYRTNNSLMAWTQRPFYWIAQRVSNVVFIVSDNVSASEYANEMKNKSKAKFVGIGSPIDLSKFNIVNINRRIEEKKNTSIESFIYVGRLSPEKNVIKMIEALSIYIKNTRKDSVKLHIIGDGPDISNLKKGVWDYRVEKNVIFYGRLPKTEIYNRLEQSDVFLITSNGEGVSISVLEAFASGLPVVCYAVPGLERQNVNHVTGVIAENKSSQAFALAMEMVGKNKTKYSLSCLEEAKKYEDSVIAGKIIDEIDSMTKFRKKGA